MNNAVAFLKLDLLTVKPYMTWKNLLILIGLAIFFLFNGKNVLMMSIMFMMYGILFVSFPFSVGEQNGIDALYTALGIDRSSVVRGRYLFALFVNVSCAMIGLGFAMFMNGRVVQSMPMEMVFLVVALSFLAYSLIESIQFPIYFAMGHNKAKIVAMVPFFAIPFGAGAMVKLLEYFKIDISPILEASAKNAYLTIAVLVATALVILGISYKIAEALYRKRDLG